MTFIAAYCASYNAFDVLTITASAMHHVTLLTPTVGTAIKHPMQDRVKPSFVIFEIRAL